MFHKVLAVVLQATAAVLCLIARFFLTSLFKFFRFLGLLQCWVWLVVRVGLCIVLNIKSKKNINVTNFSKK